MISKVGILICLFFLGGCALPPALELLSLSSTAANGISLAVSDRTATDHIMSKAIGEDCITFRLLKGGPICQPVPIEQIADRKSSTIIFHERSTGRIFTIHTRQPVAK